MQTTTKLRIKNLVLAMTMFACLAMPLWLCYTWIMDLKALMETNPLVKIPVAAILFAVFLGYIKHKTGYELTAPVKNVNIIGGSHD